MKEIILKVITNEGKPWNWVWLKLVFTCSCACVSTFSGILRNTHPFGPFLKGSPALCEVFVYIVIIGAIIILCWLWEPRALFWCKAFSMKSQEMISHSNQPIRRALIERSLNAVRWFILSPWENWCCSDFNNSIFTHWNKQINSLI